MKEEVSKPYGNIYFEKNLPKNCGGCPFQYDGISCEALDYGFCPEELGRCLDSKYGTAAYDDAIFDRRYSKCPLATTQSLKQQVREEVVEEIINAIDDKFNCLGYVEEKFEDVKKYILNQMKGENNEQKR